MQEDQRISVVVLYLHPLFGEGIARLLATEPGLDVVPVAESDAASAERLLEAAPDVVIFERGEPDTATDLLRSAPGALIIDVSLSPGPTFTIERHEIRDQPEGILQAIRRIRTPDRRREGAAPVGR